MAKRKNKKKQQEQTQEGDQENNGENNSEASNEGNKVNQKGVILLGVYIHCPGCSDNVLKCLRGFDGVEGIEIDSKNHKVTVKGKRADPIKVAERLRKKSGKHVELISPKPPKEKKEEKKEEKEKEPPVVEVVLKVYMHCEGCAKDVKQCIHKMPGVQIVNPDMEKNLVTVKGAIEPEKLVEFVNKRGGRNAEIVKRGNQNQQESKNGNQGKKDFYDNYPPELVYAPQLFSDENPNSCSVM